MAPAEGATNAEAAPKHEETTRPVVKRKVTIVLGLLRWRTLRFSRSLLFYLNPDGTSELRRADTQARHGSNARPYALGGIVSPVRCTYPGGFKRNSRTEPLRFSRPRGAGWQYIRHQRGV